MTILNDDDSANGELKRTMDVNFMDAVYCTREAYKSMMKRDAYGCIININSIDGHYVNEMMEMSGFKREAADDNNLILFQMFQILWWLWNAIHC